MPVQTWYARGLGLMLRREVEQYVRNQALVERLDDLVTHDQLTGAYSRRYMMEQLEQQVAMHLPRRALRPRGAVAGLVDLLLHGVGHGFENVGALSAANGVPVRLVIQRRFVSGVDVSIRR